MASLTVSTGRETAVVIRRVLFLFCVFITQIIFGTTAPTHHLTISAGGKIPMIIVTSSEKNFTHASHLPHFVTNPTSTSIAENESDYVLVTTSKPIVGPHVTSSASSSLMSPNPPDLKLREETASQVVTATNPTEIINTPKSILLYKPTKKPVALKSTKSAKSELNNKTKTKAFPSLILKNKVTDKTTKSRTVKSKPDKNITEEESIEPTNTNSNTERVRTTVTTENLLKEDSHNTSGSSETPPHNNDHGDNRITTEKPFAVNQVVRPKLTNDTNQTEKTSIHDDAEDAVSTMNLTQEYGTHEPLDTSTSTHLEERNLGKEILEEGNLSLTHNEKESLPDQQRSSLGSRTLDRKIMETVPPKSAFLRTVSAEVGTETATTLTAFKKTYAGEEGTAVFSTTVFQVPDSQTSTTHFPSNTQFQSTPTDNLNSEGRTPQFYEYGKQTESKISDIQIEVYDSTVDSILSSTNFKESSAHFRSPLEIGIEGTKPPSPSKQEKFTQYVIDRSELSTQVASITPIPIAPGKPEPAAIEIHINVSEGLENESEDLQFSYRQSEINQPAPDVSSINLKIPDLSYNHNVSDTNMSEQNDEILVVEIIDTGDNSTENPESFENININPIFAIRPETVQEIDLKDSKSTLETGSSKPHASDDLFMPDVRQEIITNLQTTPKPSIPHAKHILDHDSDTIFYISNTEVKVGETLPTPSATLEQQLKRAKLENRFFPANYMTSTRPNAVKMPEQRRFEEDIILSPIQNTADTMKIVRSRSENPPPLDVTYVGESIIEVEQSAGGGIVIATPSVRSSATSNVLIQPTVLPEISVGVPIIGELPPQIELKEIDFMPGEANVDGNEVEKIIESSMQYGGDLIDEGGVISGGGFDSIEGSYPFGNSALLKTNAESTDLSENHRINNLKKDDLIADISGSAELSMSPFLENATIKDGLLKNESDFGGDSVGEETSHTGNETAFSVIENPITNTDLSFIDFQTLALELSAVTIPLLVAVYCGKRYFYKRLQARQTSLERHDSTNHLANGKTNGDNDQNEPTAWPSQTEHLPTLATTDVIIETITKSRNDSLEKPILPSNSSHSVPNDSSFGNCEALNTATPKASPNQSNSVLSSNYTGPNGSVTTMTLKNNHLIVETEERNDISRDARETKMHYSIAEKDGIFVVEVARGIDSKSMPDSPVSRTNKNLLAMEAKRIYAPAAPANAVRNVVNNHEEVQIHQPPLEKHNLSGTEELQMELHQIDEVDEPIPSPYSAFTQANEDNFGLVRMSNTGLSQSDLSSTSSSDSNKRYSYGNQELYTLEKPVHSPLFVAVESPLQAPSEKVNDDDHQSENGQNGDQIQAKVQAASPDTSQRRQGNRQTASSEKQQPSNGSKKEALLLNGGHTKQQQIPTEKTAQQTPGNAAMKPVMDPVHNKLDIIVNGNFAETNGRTDIDSNGYDSIISLPDPPSIEEIKQLNDCNYIEASQFDSLPPPPPPPPFMTDTNDDDQQSEMSSTSEERYVECSNLLSVKDRRAPKDLASKISATPLTPPASPPLYSTFGNEIPTTALAVNVNGS